MLKCLKKYLENWKFGDFFFNFLWAVLSIFLQTFNHICLVTRAVKTLGKTFVLFLTTRKNQSKSAKKCFIFYIYATLNFLALSTPFAQKSLRQRGSRRMTDLQMWDIVQVTAVMLQANYQIINTHKPRNGGLWSCCRVYINVFGKLVYGIHV